MKRVFSLLLALALAAALAVPAFAAEGFSDVPAGHTFRDAIMDCAAKGITSGYADGTFRPADSVTKAQFCVMLSRAFYPNEIGKYTDPTGRMAWFAPNTTALYYAGVLRNTSFELSYPNRTVMGEPITRLDMAQLMSNIMAANGFSATDAQKAEAKTKIGDFNVIPSGYQDAVANVFSLKIINGYPDGSFGGEKIMNRGQSCVTIYRMMQYTPAATPSPEPEPDTPKPSEEPVSKPTTVTVTSEPTSIGTAWKIADSGYGDGKLNNGKDITQENVLELLAEAKKIWPNGMTWTDNSVTSGNNSYSYEELSKSIAATTVMRNGAHPNLGCGGFAAMLSDYIFSTNSNPVRKLSDNTQVHPGDIVFRFNPDGSVAHVNIALTTVGTTNGGNPGVRTANGNSGRTVDWRDTARNYTDRIDDYERTPGQWCRCVIYTRYPD